MNNSRFQLAIFDLDGVICDTARYHFIAWKAMADRLGIRFTEADNERLKGVSRMASLDIVLSLSDDPAIRSMPEIQRIELATEKNTEYVKLISAITQDELLPGVKSFIKTLKENGLRIALGSVSKNAGIILSRLNITDLFDVLVDGNNVAKAKPDPEVFLYSATELGIPTDQCVVFEDAFEGIKAARNAKMSVVGIGDPLILHEADLVVPGFQDIKKLMDFILSPLS